MKPPRARGGSSCPRPPRFTASSRFLVESTCSPEEQLQLRKAPSGFRKGLFLFQARRRTVSNAIELSGLSKTFRSRVRPTSGLIGVVGQFLRPSYEEIMAIRDVSFSI